LAKSSLPTATDKLRALRDRLWKRLQDGLGDRVILNGHPERRLPNTLNANFVGHIGSELLEKVDGIAASTGSACHEGHVTVSPVLCAMGIAPEISRGALRLTVGRFSTEQEIDEASEILCKVARH
jgi:cysteine desulfurase